MVKSKPSVIEFKKKKKKTKKEGKKFKKNTALIYFKDYTTIRSFRMNLHSYFKTQHSV